MTHELLKQCNVCDSTELDLVDPDCNITLCRVCGYIFANPRPVPEELVRFYSQPGKYDSWLQELEAREALWKRRLEKLQPTKKLGSLLDVGTGIGQFLAVARGCYTEAHGTEVSVTAIEISKQIYGLELFRGTLEELAAKGKTFDNVTLFHVLEHVPDPRSQLAACHSLLADGGILVVAVPNEVASLRGLKRRVLGARDGRRLGRMGLPRITLDGSIDEIHLSHFTPRVLERLVTSAGFVVVESTLDPHYIRKGARGWKDDIYYLACLVFLKVLRRNIYDAILMVARKTSPYPQRSGDAERVQA